EVDNGDPVEFVEPRKARPYPTYLYVQDTPLGKKISLELGSAFDNAFYLNEIAQINTDFTVPIENASKVTLLDNLGKISGRAFGYTSEGYKSIQYSMKVSLSKKINGTWETESFEYNSENLLPVTEWVELTLNF
ncbi:MAG: hypothetical protein KGY45_01485, partial [Hadesarchaea archaeon]|nr:hypothetical protein [Hadesarchaea archaeon]